MHEAVLGVSKVAAEASASKSHADPGVVSQFQSYFFKLMDGQKVIFRSNTIVWDELMHASPQGVLRRADVPGIA